MSYRIAKSIPIPRANLGRPKAMWEQKYPWRQMVPGDSFFVPGPPKSLKEGARQYGSRYGLIYVTRTITERGVKGTRIWCVGPRGKAAFGCHAPVIGLDKARLLKEPTLTKQPPIHLPGGDRILRLARTSGAAFLTDVTPEYRAALKEYAIIKGAKIRIRQVECNGKPMLRVMGVKS